MPPIGTRSRWPGPSTTGAVKRVAAFSLVDGLSSVEAAKPWSCERYLATGQMMPEDGIDELRQHDAVFLGAVGFPGVPDHVSLWGLLIPIRRSFDQYVNLRPVRLWPGVASPLAGRGPDDIDMVIVRENSEGEYSLIGGRHGTGAAEFAVQQSVFTRRGVERIARYAFGLAERRRGSVCSATKSNGIVHTMPFWNEIVAGVAAEFPGVAYEQVHADARGRLQPLR